MGSPCQGLVMCVAYCGMSQEADKMKDRGNMCKMQTRFFQNYFEDRHVLMITTKAEFTHKC